MPQLRRLLLLLLLLVLAPLVARAAELTERELLFAHHHLAGTEPDFAALAEQEVAGQTIPESVRDVVAERRYRLVLAMRRLRAAFAAFDLDRPVTVTVSADILGHDRERGGSRWKRDCATGC